MDAGSELMGNIEKIGAFNQRLGDYLAGVEFGKTMAEVDVEYLRLRDFCSRRITDIIRFITHSITPFSLSPSSLKTLI